MADNSEENAGSAAAAWLDAMKYTDPASPKNKAHPLHEVYNALSLYHRRSPLFEEMAANLSMLAGALAVTQLFPSILDARGLKMALGRAGGMQVAFSMTGSLASYVSRATLASLIFGVATQNWSTAQDRYASLATLDGMRKPDELEFANLYAPIPTGLIKPTVDDLARVFMVAKLERGVRMDLAISMTTTINDYLKIWGDRNGVATGEIRIGEPGMPTVQDLISLRPPVSPNRKMASLIEAARDVAITDQSWVATSTIGIHLVQGIVLVLARGWAMRNRWLSTTAAVAIPEALKPSTDLYGDSYWDMRHFMSWLGKALHLSRRVIDAIDDLALKLRQVSANEKATEGPWWAEQVNRVVDESYAPLVPHLVAQGHHVRLNPESDGYAREMAAIIDPGYWAGKQLLIGG